MLARAPAKRRREPCPTPGVHPDPTILGSRKLQATDILGMGSTNTPVVPIRAPNGPGESLQAYPAKPQSAIWLRKINDVSRQVRP